MFVELVIKKDNLNVSANYKENHKVINTNKINNNSIFYNSFFSSPSVLYCIE